MAILSLSGAIKVEKRVSFENEVLDFLHDESNIGSYFRIYTIFMSKINDARGSTKFSLSKNTMTFYRSNLIACDFVRAGDDINLTSFLDNEQPIYPRFYFIERM